MQRAFQFLVLWGVLLNEIGTGAKRFQIGGEREAFAIGTKIDDPDTDVMEVLG